MRRLPTWGLAWEQPLGPVTAHIETFGQCQAKPSLQVGLRTEIAKGLQLDGTLGRMGRDTVFSLGTKISF